MSGDASGISLSDPQPWLVEQRTVAFQNRWVTVALDQVRLPTARTYEYTRVDVNGVGVAVIGFNAAGEVLLEREYRHGVGQVIWQLPGGLANRNEDLVAAGLRELLEETGHATESHLVAAWDLIETAQPRRDPAEFVTLHWRSVAWLKAAIRSGEIQERTTVAAVAHLLLSGEL